MLARVRTVLLTVSFMLAGIVGFSTPAQAAEGNILAPFDLGQTWNICQGYNNPNVTHTGTSSYGLDLTGAGCDNSASGRTVRAPMSGTVHYYQASYGNLCVNVAGGRSYTLTHINSSITSGTISAGQAVGTVGAPGTRGNNGVAHIHFQMWATPNCYSSSGIPFDTEHGIRICGAPNLTASGPSAGNGTWSGTSFTAQACGDPQPPTPTIPTYMDGGGFHPTPTGSGYMMVLKQGNVYTQGDAQYHGGLPGGANETIVDAALRPDGKGYWLLAKGGNIYSYGAAPYYGGTPASAGATFAALARTPSGNGYLMVSMTGNVYAYGDARYFGGIPTSVGEKVVDIATTPDGGGYWILTRTGNVYACGNAGYHGGAPSGLRPFVAILPSQTGKGYALVMDTGQVYAYGDGRYFGGGPAGYGGGGITAAASTPDGGGYWLMSFAGNVYTYGNARYYGGAPGGLSGF